MSILDWPYTRTATAANVIPPADWGEWDESRPRDRYTLLRAYYDQLGLYSLSRRYAYDNVQWQQAMKAIRGVANRTVEFHAAHLWPGTLPDALTIVTDHTAIVEPIQQVWTWSNWGAQKQVAARFLAMLGDLFIKVVTREDRSRVYFEVLDPTFVSDFDADERGFLTYVRVDIPRTERRGDKLVGVTHTEVWEKDRLRVWVHEKAEDTEIRLLGTPERDEPLSAMGIDFVPFVHAKFRDVGDQRGQAAVWHALEKIDEANLKATRLSQLLFRHNNVTWLLMANGLDANNRPLPPPVVTGADGTAQLEVKTVSDDRFLSLPGMAKLESLVPNINYEAALRILQDDMMELERDLPELAYARISEQGGGDLSGRAIRFMLTPAIDRALEARGNAEAALVRANQMALTIGKAANLFPGVGSYDAGQFDHSFAARAVITVSEEEEAAALQARATAAVSLADLLSPVDLLTMVFPDKDQQEIERMAAAKESQTSPAQREADAFASALLARGPGQSGRTPVGEETEE